MSLYECWALQCRRRGRFRQCRIHFHLRWADGDNGPADAPPPASGWHPHPSTQSCGKREARLQCGARNLSMCSGCGPAVAADARCRFRSGVGLLIQTSPCQSETSALRAFLLVLSAGGRLARAHLLGRRRQRLCAADFHAAAVEPKVDLERRVMPDRPRKTACRARLRFWRDSERRRSTSCRPRPLRAQSPCQSHAQNWQRDPITTRAEAALKQRFHVGVFPSLVVNPGGKMLGVLPKVYDWPDYIARIAAMPRPGAPALVPVSGPRLRSSTPSARPRGGETLSVRRRGFRRRPSAPRRALETGAFARNWRKTDFLRWRRDGAAGGADDRSI